MLEGVEEGVDVWISDFSVKVNEEVEFGLAAVVITVGVVVDGT